MRSYYIILYHIIVYYIMLHYIIRGEPRSPEQLVQRLRGLRQGLRGVGLLACLRTLLYCKHIILQVLS